jgi:hypothetical protein
MLHQDGLGLGLHNEEVKELFHTGKNHSFKYAFNGKCF